MSKRKYIDNDDTQDNTVITVTSFPDGTLAEPGMNFASDTSLGIRKSGAGKMSLTSTNTDIMDIDTTKVKCYKALEVQDGVLATPGVHFVSDTSLGIRKSGTGQLSLTSTNTDIVDVSSTKAVVHKPLEVDYNGGSRQVLVKRADGSASAGIGVRDESIVSGLSGGINDMNVSNGSGGSSISLGHQLNGKIKVINQSTTSGFGHFQIYGNSTTAYRLDFECFGKQTVANGGGQARIRGKVDGTITTPEYAFINDTGSGLGLFAVGAPFIATSGVENVRYTTTANEQKLPLRLQAGTGVLPSLTSATDSTTGIYFPAANNMRVSAGGLQICTFDANGAELTPNKQFRFDKGTEALPGLCLNTDSTIGIWSPTTNNLAWSTAGVERLRLNNTSLTSTVPIRSTKFTQYAVTSSVSGDDYIVKATAASIVLTLPSFANLQGKEWIVFTVIGAGTISVQTVSHPATTEVFVGAGTSATSFTLSNLKCVRITVLEATRAFCQICDNPTTIT